MNYLYEVGLDVDVQSIILGYLGKDKEGYRNNFRETTLKELKQMTPIDDSNNFLFEGWIVSAQLAIIQYKKNNKTNFGVITNAWKMIKFLFGFTYQFANEDILS